MEDRANPKLVVLVVVISVLIFLLWDHFVLKPVQQKNAAATNAVQASAVTNNNEDNNSLLGMLGAGAKGSHNPDQMQSPNDEVALSNTKNRINVVNDKLQGSINLVGATIDSAVLLQYKRTTAKDSDNIVLLHPKGSINAYFYQSGYVSTNKNLDLPNANTRWSTDRLELNDHYPVTLTYKNKQGLVFKKIISIDKNYMLHIKDIIINPTQQNYRVFPWALTIRKGEPQVQNIFISHEGIVGYIHNENQQIKYKEVKKEGNIDFTSQGGYLGFADKYFMVAIIPEGNNPINVKFRYFLDNAGMPNYQADYLGQETNIGSKNTYTNETNLFLGPKEYNLLKHYSKTYNIPKFDNSIDFGWFYFITKPFLNILLLFYNYFNNFGYAMLVFTVIIRLLIFPITYTSYASMAKMRKIQPQMQALKNKYKGDMQKYNKELMTLYKKEKVNPLAGCLPLIIQIPILFSIYKVIYICIEMRQAHFWWIKDLSVADPTSIFNLFGLLPFDLPNILHIGLWAILMGLTMFIQQKLSNTNFVNDTQKRLMTWFPVILTVVLAQFPVGLLIYWTWSNILSIIQQTLINKIVVKRHGKH